MPSLWDAAQGWFRSGPQLVAVDSLTSVTTPPGLVKPTASSWQSWQVLSLERPPW